MKRSSACSVMYNDVIYIVVTILLTFKPSLVALKLFIKNNVQRKSIISYRQYTESYRHNQTLINSLRHTLSESTFVFYSSSV